MAAVEHREGPRQGPERHLSYILLRPKILCEVSPMVQTFSSMITAKPEWLAAFPPNARLTLAWPPALATNPGGSTGLAELGLSPIFPVAESKTPERRKGDAA